MSEILTSDNDKFIKVVYNWTTKIEIPGEEDSLSGTFLGFIHYATSANWVTRIDFYIPEGLKINRASVHTKWHDQLWVAGDVLRVNDAYIYLNPTKTKTTVGGSDTYIYSGGTSIRSAFTPTSDEQEESDIFTPAQVQAINYGWNTLIIQQNTQDTADEHIGRVVASLNIKGYIPWQTR